jgi:ATP-binding protein involved in chromosome partitioning
MTETPADEKRILEALKKVEDPELKVDIVTLGMIEGLAISGGKVSLTVNLTTPGCPLKAQIEKDVRAALGAVPGVESIDLTMGAKVRKSIEAPPDLIPEVANTVAIGSGKGGVGKSTVAVNLALSFARAGASVGLMDADIYGPNLVQMMGVSARPEIRERRIVPVQAHGLKLMSMGFFLKEDEPVIWRGPMLHGAIRQFLGDVEWGRLDYLFIDMPPGTGDVQLTLSQIIPLTGAVQEGARADTRRRREHVLLRVPALRGAFGDLQPRRRVALRRDARRGLPRGDPARHQGAAGWGRGEAFGRARLEVGPGAGVQGRRREAGGDHQREYLEETRA